jgi:hypothetical protein
MTPAEAIVRIESDDFSALANLASNLKTFLRVIAAQPEVRLLSSEMRDPQVTATVLQRVLEWCGTPAEPGYEHPADAAVAVLLWLLGGKDQDYADIGAGRVLGCTQFWWARKVAESITSATRFHSDTGSVKTQVDVGWPVVDFSGHACHSLETIQPLVLPRRAAATVPAAIHQGRQVDIAPIWGSSSLNLFKNFAAGNQLAAPLPSGK